MKKDLIGFGLIKVKTIGDTLKQVFSFIFLIQFHEINMNQVLFIVM